MGIKWVSGGSLDFQMGFRVALEGIGGFQGICRDFQICFNIMSFLRDSWGFRGILSFKEVSEVLKTLMEPPWNSQKAL